MLSDSDEKLAANFNDRFYKSKFANELMSGFPHIKIQELGYIVSECLAVSLMTSKQDLKTEEGTKNYKQNQKSKFYTDVNAKLVTNRNIEIKTEAVLDLFDLCVSFKIEFLKDCNSRVYKYCHADLIRMGISDTKDSVLNDFDEAFKYLLEK